MSTIKAYRLIKRKWSSHAFDGEGSRLNGGRWNSKGVACVYTADCESLSILETVVHLASGMHLDEWCMYEIELDERQLLKLDHSALPANWFEIPSPVENTVIGDDWIHSNESVGLVLPSSVARRDNNIMLNPEHPHFDRVMKTAKEIDFFLDGRL